MSTKYFVSLQIIPALLDALAILGSETSNKNILYSLLLVLSGILMDDNGKKILCACFLLYLEFEHVDCVTSFLMHFNKINIDTCEWDCSNLRNS